MVRAVLSAVLGYFVMVAICMIGIALTWYSFGNRFAFSGDTMLASTPWSLIQLAFGFLAAWMGGSIAIRTAGSSRARQTILILTIAIIGLGLLNLALQLRMTVPPLPEGKTIDTLTFMDAGQYSISPWWFNVAIIFVGIAGLWIALAQHLPKILASNPAQREQA